MPNTCATDRATGAHASAEPSTISMRPICDATRRHVEIARRRPDVPHEPRDEPRPVPALERDLLIVNDDRIHEIASCGRRPLSAAPSIVAGSPVSIQSPARHKPSTSVSGARPRRLAWCQRERRAPSPERPTRAAPSHSRVRQRVAKLPQRQRDELVVLHRQDARAPLDTSVRCDVPENTWLLSKTHCMVRPGSPRKRLADQRRSSQRLTLAIGSASVAAADASKRLERRKVSDKHPGRHTTARHTRRRRAPPFPARLHMGHAARRDDGRERRSRSAPPRLRPRHSGAQARRTTRRAGTAAMPAWRRAPRRRTRASTLAKTGAAASCVD